MNKHRISTTISQKHWAMLNKFTEKYNTQQKALEQALESMEQSTQQISPRTREEETWARIGSELKDTLAIFFKDQARILLETADIPRFQQHIIDHKPAEYAVEYYNKKPLNECSLQEVVDAMIQTIKFQGSADSINYTDNEDHYIINITHNYGINSSKICVMMNDSLIKSCGIEAERHFSERSIYYKIYKNLK